MIYPQFPFRGQSSPLFVFFCGFYIILEGKIKAYMLKTDLLIMCLCYKMLFSIIVIPCIINVKYRLLLLFLLANAVVQ